MIYPLLIVWATGCAWQDARFKRIANWLTFPAMLVALIYLLWGGTTLTGASGVDALFAVIVVLLLMLPGYMMGKLGAGDIKMLLALALATDAILVLVTILGAAISMGLWVGLGAKCWPYLSPSVRSAIPQLSPTVGAKLPYGPFVLLGVVAISLGRAVI